MQEYTNNDHDPLPVKPVVPGETVPSGKEPSRSTFFPLKYALLLLVLIFLIGMAVRLIPRQGGQGENPSPRKKDRSASAMEKQKPFAYKLEGLIYDGEASTVIIDGRVVKLHEKIGDFEIIEVTPSSVKVRNTLDGSTKNLSL